MSDAPRHPLDFTELPPERMQEEAEQFYQRIRLRRSVRDFSDRPVDRHIIDTAIRAAGTAPNGANHQPWHFAVISSPENKRRIREAAEEEERAFYHQRAPEEWLDALAPLGTDEHKPFLETAPYLIAIFGKQHDFDAAGNKIKNYYVTESVGIATGMLITALHLAGLATLTHTPSPMSFLRKILDRPANERAFLLLVVGYPTDGATVPAINKLPLADITSYH